MASSTLLAALLDSWDRNNTILINLLCALPEGTLELRPTETSPTIGGLFAHIHYCRLVFVAEDAPEFAKPVPEGSEWRHVYDREQIVRWLTESAQVLRAAVQDRLQTGKDMNLHYAHPVLMLQHMIWHEGYHHGQIKLALKLASQPFDDEEIGQVTWDVWMDKKASAQPPLQPKRPVSFIR